MIFLSSTLGLIVMVFGITEIIISDCLTLVKRKVEDFLLHDSKSVGLVFLTF